MKHKVIYLTGFMGTGKSSVAKWLAKDLKIPYYDIDDNVEQNAGISISDIFEKHGEQHFRQLERIEINNLNKDDYCIVALGGGAITWGDNLNYIKQTGVLISLMATPEEIYERVSSAKTVRPLLNCDNPLEKIVSLMQKRVYYYIKSDIMVDTNNKTVKEVAEVIIKLLQKGNTTWQMI